MLDAALQLPHPARALLAERLLEGLDAEPEFPVSAQWLAEIKRRCGETDRGEVKLISGDRVFEPAFEALG